MDNDVAKQRDYNLKILTGCGGLLILFLVLGPAFLIVGLGQDRETARYPGAASLSSHSNYTGLPFEYRWDDAYVADDQFTAVYNWYSTRFDLGAESRAAERCILLDGEQRQLFVRRTINVLLCDTDRGQMIFVTRSTALNR